VRRHVLVLESYSSRPVAALCTQSGDDLAVSDWLQEAVWAELGEAVAENLLQGWSHSVLAYGHAGAGKFRWLCCTQWCTIHSRRAVDRQRTMGCDGAQCSAA
jgi:hypothetical protein